MTTSNAPNSDFLPDDPSPAIAREGWPIVAIFIIAAGVATFLGGWLLGPFGWLGAAIWFVLVAWCIWFFRDPPRKTPRDPLAVVTPADGRIVAIGPATPPAELGLNASQVAGMVRVCVFMNVFDVHVNRAPVEGTIVALKHMVGKFFNAALDKASSDNERMSMALRMRDGRVVVAVQIAGLVARRIICRKKEGDTLRPGQRYGLIRFGSRVDVYMPAGSTPTVQINQRVVAGETVLGRLSPTN